MLYSNARRASLTERTAIRPVRRGVRRLNHRSRRVLAALLVPALVAGLLAAGFALFSDASDASNPPPLGIYIGYENTSGVSSLGSAIGQQPAYAMDYLDGTSWSTMESSAANEAAAWSGSGYSMTFSVPMLPNSGATLADGTSGDYNAYYQQIAQGLVANNEASSIVRIGWEFNGSWMPWYASSSDASEFVSFWQQAVTAMRSVSGADFQFEWCPNGGDTTDNMSSFYPGNSYVDIVAEDVYDQAWGTYPGESQISPTSRPWATASTGSPRSPPSRASPSPWASGGLATGQATPASRTRRAINRYPGATTPPSSTTWRSGSSATTCTRPPTSTTSPWR